MGTGKLLGQPNKMLGGNLALDRLASHPGELVAITPSRLPATETGISSSSVGQFGSE